MPTTLTALLIVLFGVVPGIPGERLYRLIIGTDWREQQWHRVIRLLAISMGGLALYAWSGQLFGLRIHEYQLPAASEAALEGLAVKTNALALGGHIVSSVVIGGIAGLTMRRMVRYAPVTLYPDTWDEFARSYVARHWVVVRLENEDAYAGVLVRADTSVKREERDILLAEPAVFSKEIANYQLLPYQYLFLPGHLISSIAVVYDSKIDTRLSPVNVNLWPQPSGDDQVDNQHEQERP